MNSTLGAVILSGILGVLIGFLNGKIKGIKKYELEFKKPFFEKLTHKTGGKNENN